MAVVVVLVGELHDSLELRPRPGFVAGVPIYASEIEMVERNRAVLKAAGVA